MPALAAIAHLFRRPGSRAGARNILGAAGEKAAERRLRSLGYRILARNFVAPMGEVDLLARDPDGLTTVLVEVKTRTVVPGVVQPPPEAQITWAKAQTLLDLARHLARRNGWPRGRVRIDVVAIEQDSAGVILDLRHHPGAVSRTGPDF